MGRSLTLRRNSGTSPVRGSRAGRSRPCRPHRGLHGREQGVDELVRGERGCGREPDQVAGQCQPEQLVGRTGARCGRPCRPSKAPAAAGRPGWRRSSRMRAAARSLVTAERSSTSRASSAGSPSQRSRKWRTSGAGQRPRGTAGEVGQPQVDGRGPRRTAAPCCRSSASPSTGRCRRRRRRRGWWCARSPSAAKRSGPRVRMAGAWSRSERRAAAVARRLAQSCQQL